MSTRKELTDVPKAERDSTLKELENKGAKIIEVIKQVDGLFTIIYDIPTDDSSDDNGGGRGGGGGGGGGGTGFSPDIIEGDAFDSLSFETDEGGSRDFP